MQYTFIYVVYARILQNMYTIRIRSYTAYTSVYAVYVHTLRHAKICKNIMHTDRLPTVVNAYHGFEVGVLMRNVRNCADLCETDSVAHVVDIMVDVADVVDVTIDIDVDDGIV